MIRQIPFKRANDHQQIYDKVLRFDGFYTREQTTFKNLRQKFKKKRKKLQKQIDQDTCFIPNMIFQLFFSEAPIIIRSRFTLKLCRKSTRIQSFSLMVLQRTTSIKVLSEIVGLLRPQHALQRNPNSLKRYQSRNSENNQGIQMAKNSIMLG